MRILKINYNYNIFLFVIGFILLSCDPENVIVDANEAQDDDTEQIDGVEEDSDYSWDQNSEVDITLSGFTVAIAGKGASFANNVVTISYPGNYRISGNLTDGRVIVNTSGIVRLIMDGAAIHSSVGPPIFVADASKVVVILADGKSNTISDVALNGSSIDTLAGCLHAKSYLAVYGTGSLVIDAKNKDGIVSKDGLVLKSGTLAVTSKDDAIVGKDYVKVHDGNYTIISGGDGIKSTNTTGVEKGFVEVTDGELNIISTGDGISASTVVRMSGGIHTIKTGGGSTQSNSVSAKALKGGTSVIVRTATVTIDSGDDAVVAADVLDIYSGTLLVKCSGGAFKAINAFSMHGGTVAVTTCTEGVESRNIMINEGAMSIVSSDDALNATAGTRTENNDGSLISIGGGIITLNGKEGDPLDSNGSIVMTGGTVIIHGPSKSPEVPIDYNGTFNISGGLLIATGPSLNMAQGTSQSSTQNCIIVKFSTSNLAGTLFHISNSKGDNIVTFSPLRSYVLAVFSSHNLVQGETYTIYTSGSVVGENNDGLFSSPTYTPGNMRKQFTVASTVTTISI